MTKGLKNRMKMRVGDQKWTDLLIKGIHEFDFHINHQQIDQFTIHVLELLRWNQKFNLTAITEPLDIIVKHIIDSIALAKYISLDKSVLDIGSGGGFPGIPIKILIPSLSMTLIDASHKKVSFLKHIIRELKMVNIQVQHTRAEMLFTPMNQLPKKIRKCNGIKAKNTHKKVVNSRPKFDVIISRALSSLDRIVQLAIPLMNQNGTILALKGKITQKEIKKAKENMELYSKGDEGYFYYYHLRVERYRLPYIGSDRSIIRINLDG